MSSRNVPIHILRGLAGFALLAIALGYFGDLGWWALLPAAGALLCLGGCPMCWIIGLVATVMDRKAAGGCSDGSCHRVKLAPVGNGIRN